jgi:heat shock protein HslJ
MNARRIGWIVLAVACACAGCAGTSPGNWVIDRLETPDGKPAQTPAGFSLELQSSGAVKAEDGCNSCSGSWTQSRSAAGEGVIDVLCTRMYCEQYADAMALVGGISTWKKRDNRIEVPSGRYRIILRRK